MTIDGVEGSQTDVSDNDGVMQALTALPAGCSSEVAREKEDGEAIQPLPPASPALAGSTNASGKYYNITVSNKAGYMCHVHVVSEWPVPPEVPFAIFTHPDNSALFRDVKRIGNRKVTKTEPGYKEVQVEQLGDIQVLWMHRTYSTWLNVIEDSRDPECLRTIFTLLKSDVLGKFSGEWEMRPVHDSATGKVLGCRAELHQDVLPKGMPAFMARLPVLGGLLRGVSVRAVERVMQDFNVVLAKVQAAHAAGRSTEAVLRELCGPVSEAAHANGAVTSFAFDAAEEEEDEASADGAVQSGASKSSSVQESSPDGNDSTPTASLEEAAKEVAAAGGSGVEAPQAGVEDKQP